MKCQNAKASTIDESSSFDYNGSMTFSTEITAREAKNHFGELLDSAQRAPVKITKNGRGVAVLLSLHDFKQAFEEAEDELWAERAKEAAKGGFLSTEESAAFMKKYLNE
jgi:antitoxin Phd